MTAVLLLEAAGPESGALARTAARRGLTVYAAAHSARQAASPPGLNDLVADWLTTDFTVPDRALEDITAFARHHRIDAVLTASEYLTPLAARTCAALALPGNDPNTAVAARNKAAMAARLAHAGVDAPATFLPATAEHAAALARRPGLLPCVVKPAEHAGSRGLTFAYDTDQVVAGYERARTLRYDPAYGTALDPQVLMQPLTIGTEYSVESLTTGGRHSHVCITRKHTNVAGIETGHDLPAVLPSRTRRRILAETGKALAALGIRNSASHTEVIVEPSGRCRVIEVAARSGAGRIGFLIGYALGIDWWQGCLDTSLGLPADLAPTRSRHAAIRFITAPRRGILQRVDHLPHGAADVPEVHLRAAFGDPVGGASGNSARLGCFVTTGTGHGAVSQRADDLLAAIRVRLAPELPSPPVLEKGVQRA